MSVLIGSFCPSPPPYWFESTPPTIIGIAVGFIVVGLPFRSTSAIPLPWPLGCRPETLRPHLSVEFAFLGGVEFSEMFIGIII
jgi:hypothetical protein